MDTNKEIVVEGSVVKDFLGKPIYSKNPELERLFKESELYALAEWIHAQVGDMVPNKEEDDIETFIIKPFEFKYKSESRVHDHQTLLKTELKLSKIILWVENYLKTTYTGYTKVESKLGNIYVSCKVEEKGSSSSEEETEEEEEEDAMDQ